MHESVELKSLIYDNTSGAREVAQRALQLLQKTATTSAALAPAALMDELVDTAVKVVRSKPEMAQVFQTLNRFFLEAEALEAAPKELGEFRIGVVSLLNEHALRFPRDLHATATHAQALLKNGTVVLTHSRSTTVLEALRAARTEGKLIDVIVPESRPMLEGRHLARELAEEQIPVRFIVDSLLGTAVRGCDRILVGADSVTANGFINKAGTHLIALAAQDAGVPLNVLAEMSKAWVKKIDPNLALLQGRQRDPKEVWDHPPYGVEVVNQYFDSTPLSLVDSIVCEAGALSPADYWSHVRTRGYARKIREQFPDELL